jgi:hypothetical protein
MPFSIPDDQKASQQGVGTESLIWLLTLLKSLREWLNG